MLREMAKAGIRLQQSSVYRMMRGQSKRLRTANYAARKWDREQVAELNEHLREFPGVICVTDCPDAWVLDDTVACN